MALILQFTSEKVRMSMIDLEKAKQYFKQYISNYDLEEPRIKLKIVHTYHVAENSRKIAETLNLSEEEQNLAELIGLLHDIGRFEQVRMYGTFADEESIDHADKGVEVLFEEGQIRNFVEDNQYDEIIRKAVKNHNQFEMENGLSEEEILHCKIIRDSDKLDIYRAFLEEKLENVVHLETTDVSQEILTPMFVGAFKKEKLLLFSHCKTNMDFLVAIMAFIYELNFKETLEIIRQNDYIYKLVQKIDAKDAYTREKLNEIADYAMGYMERKINIKNENE